jgi:hypothetical protein
MPDLRVLPIKNKNSLAITEKINSDYFFYFNIVFNFIFIFYYFIFNFSYIFYQIKSNLKNLIT